MLLIVFPASQPKTMKKLARPNPLLKCNQIVAENAARGAGFPFEFEFEF